MSNKTHSSIYPAHSWQRPFSSLRPLAHQRLLILAAVLVIGVVALGLRVWGAGWSLPYVDHPDEPAVVDVILRIMQGDLNPDHFFYPSLILYLQALVFKLHFWVGSLSGLYGETFTLPESNHFYTTIPAAFVWGRVFTALIGTATVLALAAWARRFVGTRAALVAAALLALSPWAIVQSHYIAVDAPAALFALLALLAVLGVLRGGSWHSYILAGVLVGLATGSKYQNVLVVVSLLLAHVWLWRRASLRYGWRLVGAGLISAAVFLLTSPYIVLDFAGFMRDMETLFTSYEAGHGDIGRAWPIDAYLRFWWLEGLGPLPFLLALVGAVALWRSNRARAVVLLSFPLLMLLVLLRMETHFYRNMLPAQAPLMLLAGVGAVAIWDYVKQRLPQRMTYPAAAILLALLLLPSLVPAYRASARLALPDARVVAQEWARDTYPGVQIAAELSHPLAWNGIRQGTYQFFLPLHSAEWYRQQGYGLLLANAGRRGKDEWSDAYAPLLDSGEVVFSVGGRFSDHLGPRIDLIDIGLIPQTVPDTMPTVDLGPLRLLDVRYGRRVKEETGLELRPEAPLRQGDTLGLTAFWLAAQPVPADDYTLFVHLRGPDGLEQTPVQRDTPPWQGLFPPERWPPGQIVTEKLDMFLPYELPPGEYRLVLGLYDPQDGTRFAATLPDNTRLPYDEVELGRINIVAR
jgi:4-amino-4-deoxy-L-arabinose transferase-like glycosyltransferase